MVKNYNAKFISEILNSQLSFDFNSVSPAIETDAPSEMCIQNILGFSAAVEILPNNNEKPFLVLRN